MIKICIQNESRVVIYTSIVIISFDTGVAYSTLSIVEALSYPVESSSTVF